MNSVADLERRLVQLVEMRRKHLDRLRANQADSGKDKTGSASASLAHSLRFLGVAAYVLEGNVERFRTQVSEAALLQLKLFERFGAGDPISPSYVSMLSYKSLLDALSAGNVGLAVALVKHMGGREDIERQQDRAFDTAFGYLLKNLVADDIGEAAKWLVKFKLACGQRENADFRGYSDVCEAIVQRSSDKVNTGFVTLIEGHRRQTMAGGLFKDTEDEMLCVWGIGLANLARLRGVHTSAFEPLIPAALLI